MKKFILSITLILAVLSGFNSVAQKGHYGAKITDSGVMAMGDVVKQLDTSNEIHTKVEGKVSSVCQAKGCWMNLEVGDGTTMRVTFKDYAFFVPKDLAGKTVVVEGTAMMNTTSVEELRHYAEDAKKTKEEIESINEPKKELVFEAEGVIVR